MNALLTFVMRGPMQAAAVAAAGLLLGYALPPLAWLSGAVLALVMLRLGDGPLLRALAPAFAVAVAVGGVALGRPGGIALAGLTSWGPPIVLARVLGRTGRLAYALGAAVLLGWLVVLGVHLALADPASAWRDLLLEVLPPEQLAAEMGSGIDAERLRELIESVAPVMTALVAASLVLGGCTALLLARWWQARLDRPGAFAAEFQALRLGRVAGSVAVLLALAALTTPWRVMDGLALVAACVYLFQGLSVMHGLVARRGMGRGWLIGLYVLLALMPVQVSVGLMLVGVVDAWADFRSRVAGT